MYKSDNGELIFSHELPKDKDIHIIELDKISKSFDGFDYNILLDNNIFDEMANLVQVLSKNKFSIPYVYALSILKTGNTELLTQNTDFRFFKSEIQNINSALQNFTEEEILAFFKFATSLGCFSTEKLLDKRNMQTQIPMAQKASSLLAIILKTDGMKLR